MVGPMTTLQSVLRKQLGYTGHRRKAAGRAAAAAAPCSSTASR